MTIRTLAAACGAAFLCQFAVSSTVFAADAPTHWVSAWATALQPIPQRSDLPPLYRAPEVGGRTVRQIIYPTLSGKSARVHLSNEYGKTSLVIAELRIARSAGGAAALSNGEARVTFDGKSAVSIPRVRSWTATRFLSTLSKVRRMRSVRSWGRNNGLWRGIESRAS